MAILNLSQQQTNAFRLWYRGWTTAQIAAQLEVSQSTAHRAVKKAKAKIIAAGGNPERPRFPCGPRAPMLSLDELTHPKIRAVV